MNALTQIPKKSKHPYNKHGMDKLKKAVRVLGRRVLDKRTHAGKALTMWKQALIKDLGDDISTQQTALVELCMRSKLILDSVDTWILTQPTLINKRKRCLIPVVKERQNLADGLARYLAMLSLERRAKEVLNLSAPPTKDGSQHLDEDYSNLTPEELQARIDRKIQKLRENGITVIREKVIPTSPEGDTDEDIR